MDFATSVMTCGKMEVYAKIGHELQPGMLVDETGTTCLDPNVFLRIRDNKSNPAYTEKTRGGIMPMGGEGMLFGGHKGYGLALLVDIMCAVMSHGAVSKGVRVTKDKEKCCHFFAAIDYSLFGDREETNRRLSEYLQSMRDAEPAEGQSPRLCPRRQGSGRREGRSGARRRHQPRDLCRDREVLRQEGHQHQGLPHSRRGVTDCIESVPRLCRGTAEDNA